VREQPAVAGEENDIADRGVIDGATVNRQDVAGSNRGKHAGPVTFMFTFPSDRTASATSPFFSASAQSGRSGSPATSSFHKPNPK
jgi:hypothetical protein